mmetsp:Transcript_32423/g.49602  ORF Transcript_32423/g.49602 Transcript_32423/m.49602 type:complete len:146 (+) Transcript_32423:59-496(+)|eukprot:CAMPEP_0170478848 /NCGR_PEP_ID=MMETSP0208-20121228/290_1 /TAXON_ID=197538 /ORGANISM="Strombidium inclinatum, Strain S3" /LENGTH=145 /DNA_ID=CAMNT_0010751171 /DNA_START=59 /DNA_END=496 /DNA_ORIENTATION=-
MIKQYTQQEFKDEHITTLGLDFTTQKFTTKDGREVNVKIWDTAGQERFKTLTYSFYKKADGVIIAYDITDEGTFNSITTWIDSINQHAEDGVARILVGNKVDLDDSREVPRQKAEQTAKQFGINYYETSAKANLGLAECMDDIFE